MNPLDYSLCCRTVTVYRKEGNAVSRQVTENAYLQTRTQTPSENYGKSMDKPFLLIIPAGEISLQPGDRIYAGIGPEAVAWDSFIPALVPELYEVSYARLCFWGAVPAHWEAGHKEVL